MRTQKHDLKDEIKRLELSINKRLDDAKSTLINIQ